MSHSWLGGGGGAPTQGVQCHTREKNAINVEEVDDGIYGQRETCKRNIRQ